ncbi:MAG TPA: 2-oxo-4-hydroxy-4-carboxy-5-ureidoimidazoline decarboxylase, partial [Magnetospirillaceae bacterium]|nr:2-oxo-4-hydroxy-4-carboxy-5-ureidoimidazoline decarboxylase [Magnetospirillaceae bacterium]
MTGSGCAGASTSRGIGRRPTPMRHKISEINTLSSDAFSTFLGGIFEHSRWVAERALRHRPFSDRAALHAAMVAEIEEAGEEAQLRLIRAHPELAGKAAMRKELTDHSNREQAGAGLTDCSPEEYAALIRLNADYNAKFGFPFILAVKGYDRAGIIAEFSRRVGSDPDQEKRE